MKLTLSIEANGITVDAQIAGDNATEAMALLSRMIEAVRMGSGDDLDDDEADEACDKALGETARRCSVETSSSEPRVRKMPSIEVADADGFGAAPLSIVEPQCDGAAEDEALAAREAILQAERAKGNSLLAHELCQHEVIIMAAIADADAARDSLHPRGLPRDDRRIDARVLAGLMWGFPRLVQENGEGLLVLTPAGTTVWHAHLQKLGISPFRDVHLAATAGGPFDD